MNCPRIMISATKSGEGKTLITCGLLRALQKRGENPCAFKCGPDYIDPLFHRKVLGIPSYNLDTFFAGRGGVVQYLTKKAKGHGISVLEGVMGHYDGIGGITTMAGSYDLSTATQTPVVLVVDAKGRSLSLVAQIKGFLEYKKDTGIVGVILNRISPMLYTSLKPIIEEQLGISVLGYLAESMTFLMESRHLGLYLPEEIEGLDMQISMLAEEMEKTIELEKMLEFARCATPLFVVMDDEKKVLPFCKIAVARDSTFSFYYEENLELLEKNGGEIIYFSPLKDKGLPEGVSGLLLGGGYPENGAKELSENQSMKESIFSALEKGIPCVAECGGFLYLHETLEGADGVDYPMVGWVKGKAFATKKLGRFGYVNLTSEKDNLLTTKGEVLKGHEFHYWDSENNGVDFLAKKPVGNRNWQCIHAKGNFFGGFPHIHFGSFPQGVKRFLGKCRAWQEPRE